MKKAAPGARLQPVAGHRYVALLRGINVGGRTVIKMADLKAALESIGLEDVRTVLASGNALFTSARNDPPALVHEIEEMLRKTFDKEIRVVLRRQRDVKKLIDMVPFRDIAVTPDLRLYVTFFPAPPTPRAIALPYATPKGEFRILRATSTEAFSVLDLSRGKGTPDVMNVLEKEFGANITTRNWNTVLKLVE